MPDPRTTRFETLAAPHLPTLFRVAWRLTRNTADAQDLVGVATSFATAQEDASPELAGKLIVRKMALDSVAEKAGMREGDAVLEINGTPISSGQVLIKTLDALPRGVDIDVVVSRAGQTLNLKARF